MKSSRACTRVEPLVRVMQGAFGHLERPLHQTVFDLPAIELALLRLATRSRSSEPRSHTCSAALFVAAPAPVPAPGDLRVRITTKPGELNARWDAVADRHVYELQINDGDPLVEANFHGLAISGKNFFLATGLIPHKDYSFRVRAIGAEGEGAWSDIATTKPL